jgi:hypothetical protein
MQENAMLKDQEPSALASSSMTIFLLYLLFFLRMVGDGIDLM